MATAEKELKDKRVYLRVNAHQREVIEEAAQASQKDLTAFVLDAALINAERVLADRRVFQLDDQQWAEFVEALDQPATPLSEKPRLQKLIEQYGS